MSSTEIAYAAVRVLWYCCYVIMSRPVVPYADRRAECDVRVLVVLRRKVWWYQGSRQTRAAGSVAAAAAGATSHAASYANIYATFYAPLLPPTLPPRIAPKLPAMLLRTLSPTAHALTLRTGIPA
eukprot:1232961-Rhodomonas_salina.1